MAAFRRALPFVLRALILFADAVPDDLPGIPALPDPDAAPAVQVTVGSFSSIKVNVDAKGANIPGDAANGPSIAVDSTNPLRMAIGWRQFDDVESNFRSACAAPSTATSTSRPAATTSG